MLCSLTLPGPRPPSYSACLTFSPTPRPAPSPTLEPASFSTPHIYVLSTDPSTSFVCPPALVVPSAPSCLLPVSTSSLLLLLVFPPDRRPPPPPPPPVHPPTRPPAHPHHYITRWPHSSTPVRPHPFAHRDGSSVCLDADRLWILHLSTGLIQLYISVQRDDPHASHSHTTGDETRVIVHFSPEHARRWYHTIVRHN